MSEAEAAESNLTDALPLPSEPVDSFPHSPPNPLAQIATKDVATQCLFAPKIVRYRTVKTQANIEVKQPRGKSYKFYITF